MIYLLYAILILGIITAITGYFGNRRRKQTKDNQPFESTASATSTASTTSTVSTASAASTASTSSAASIASTTSTASTVASDCCGQHTVCERIPAAAGTKIEYFEDEELDQYSGVASNQHTDKAIEEFSEVLYTLQAKEVADWLRSLQLRNIHLPDSLKDEACLLMEEPINSSLKDV